MLLSDPSAGSNLGGQSDKYRRFSQRQIRSGLQSMKNFSVSLGKKKRKQICKDKLTPMCLNFLLIRPEEEKGNLILDARPEMVLVG